MKQNLLISEPPLQVLPTLAEKIGLNEALVLQQLHYWIVNPKAEGRVVDGTKWIYNTYEEWQENFPFWSIRTIQRAFLSLETQGVVLSEQFDRGQYDRRKFYRPNYEVIDELAQSKATWWHDRECQNGTFDSDKLALSLDESETTAENTTKVVPSKKNNLSEETKAAIEQNPQWAMLAGNDNQAAAVAQKQAAEKEHLDNFERIFGFNPLPWGTTPKWTRLQRFLEGKTERDFKEYVRWRENEGKFQALMNKQVYDDPDKLVATWPERRSPESVPKYVPPDESKYTPMPEDMAREIKKRLGKK